MINQTTPETEQVHFTAEQAYEAALKYFKGDDLAARVWVNKYALKDSHGHIYELTPDDMHQRLAAEIARIEKSYKNPLSKSQICDLIKDFKYLVPQGGPMTGIGNPYQIASLSNCFVIGNTGLADSYGGICKIDEEQVQLMKRRGGVGHDLSHVRPKGSAVKNSALTSTGIVPFMERYSNSTREVAQDGRRGALMLSVSIEHPDAEDFIDAKMEQGKVTGANVSVRIDDAFMQAVVSNAIYQQKYPINSHEPQFTQTIKAKKLWKKIIHNAWQSAEPGILFWDTIIRESVADCYAEMGFETVSTNPCGEIPLCSYDSCRLLAINLFSYVKHPFTQSASFDFKLFKEHAALALRLMDDIIDLELEKIDQILEKIAADPESDEVKRVEHELWQKIKKKAEQGRRTGIGITAEGDMLAALGIRYGSQKGNQFSEQVHQTLAVECYRSSVNMAKERGAFAVYDSQREAGNPFIKRLKAADKELYDDMLSHGRRNIALLTIAPTGTTSLMTQTTSGIEPVFLPVYTRRRKVNPNDKDVRIDFVDEVGDSWEEYAVFHPRFKQWMQINGHDVESHYSQAQIQALVEQSPYHQATANDVDWLSKVQMQGAVQKWVDHSISVTINLPADVDENLVDKLYMEAWKVGCKGVTVYRDGSRSGVLVATENKTEGLVDFPTKRPSVLEAEVVRFHNNKEKWIAFVGTINDKPYEIFTGLADDEDGLFLPTSIQSGLIIKNTQADGSSRYDFQFTNKRGYKTTIEGLSHKFNPEYWNYAKLISSTLRHGMPIEKVVDLINSLQLDGTTINTWKNGVSRALKRYIKDGTKVSKGVCENCQSNELIYQEGCLICKNCGASHCG
ncbi:adenosylcobalamin-dependent ribonucleoside-diphosphate reductase [Marinicella sp. S1101]|uniref:adenosylcobalamin-dependent ribonucleoside-diphosphate reductase n=1 Tax=Marinicella marina TaxID=2996016 RepID=UPI0022609F4A|nr:adenosylcobalamin-dependent ribonucleoside-diphosphate reductase [Marinicella marina]MCX7552448.1 adenosylcobalamin-dependent ribonucleoside-diphosphate reductase [Marinicella marina]MDJ1139323.1 adenosylcobalamin-dependent ribonucleoside-diphosphate reductase [Marinicella marina]